MTTATIATTPKKHNSNHLSVHQWMRSAIRDSQQPTSPIGFLFLKLPPPPCVVLLSLRIGTFFLAESITSITLRIWSTRQVSYPASPPRRRLLDVDDIRSFPSSPALRIASQTRVDTRMNFGVSWWFFPQTIYCWGSQFFPKRCPALSRWWCPALRMSPIHLSNRQNYCNIL